MKLKTKLVFGYVLAVLVSHFWLSFFGTNEELGGALEPLPGEGDLYLLFQRAGGVGDKFEGLAKELEKGEGAAVRLFEAGFGESGWELPEGGFRSLHIVGSGYGCVDALELAEALGDKVSSVTLISPTVSTRFELLGDHRLNQAMKAFQVAWFWILENAVPHFGLSERLPFNLRTASRVYEADLSEASRLFEELDVPLFVAYGENGSVASSGALEAYRKVRPSLVEIPFAGSDPDVLERHAPGLASRLLSLPRVGVLKSGRVSGTPRLDDFAGARLGSWWAGFLLAVATFASEDFACIGGGLLAASGSIGILPAVFGCLLGIFFGDLGVYFIGRVFGVAALDLPVLRRFVSPKALKKSSDWFAKRGVALVVLTRFFPGSRVPTYFAAGVVKVGWVRFTLALLLASAIWTPILVFAAFWFGDAFLGFFESLGAGGWLGIVAFIVCFALAIRVLSKLASWKGRRLLYSSWRRATSWEFWPMWAVYAPVLLQILWLAIRYRSTTLPFSVNPCMPASGLVFESKIQILEHLEKSGVPIARFEAIDLELSPEEKMERMRGFMERLGLSYPVVLKPDVGQRGQGVLIARNAADSRAFFAEQREDSIVQEYIGGSEYGVFYHRFATREKGEVSSITDKRTTAVRGDGVSTLEALILRDSRAVCMAAFFLNEYELELERVLADGEIFMLASIGTHSRGAVFLDGADLLTEELAAAVDAFSSKVEGFHFGRYDLRVPSAEHLKRGEGIRVIELNGITSEPTNMYDPKHGPIFGWRSLMRQWRLIFALAKENRLAGHEPVSKSYLAKLAIGHFKGVPSRDLF